MLSTKQRVNSGPTSIGPFHRIKVIFLLAAFASLAFSVTLWFTGAREEGLFVGLWVPAIHSLGTLILTGERENLERGGTS